jgi:hypothetical protein
LSAYGEGGIDTFVTGMMRVPLKTVMLGEPGMRIPLIEMSPVMFSSFPSRDDGLLDRRQVNRRLPE